MPQINQLSAIDQVQSGDQVPLYSQENGDARRASLSQVRQYILQSATISDDKITQYTAPSAAAFNIQIYNGSNNVWLILTPTGSLANGGITLPALSNCVDRQEVLVNCTQAVTTFTVYGNGATVTGAPVSLTANGFFRLRFDAVVKTWYRVG